VVGLFVLAHNLMRTAVLAPHIIGWGAWCVCDGHAGSMKGQKVSKSASRRLLSEALALITDVSDSIRLHVGALGVIRNGHDRRCERRKTLRL
jgi:hypothetical protein